MVTNRISIVVPAWNEQENIYPLITRINKAMKKNKILYEVILVDDRSTDATKKEIKAVSNKYPIKYVLKKGVKGKATSLFEGFAKAKYATVVMIDADLQYPPEAIPLMIDRLGRNYDIVIAKRQYKTTILLRQIASKVFSIWSKLLFGLPVDVQSGLKVMKKSALKGVTNATSPWLFDLSLLINAKKNNFTFTVVPVPFTRRAHGKSKINLLTASIDMVYQTLLFRLKDRKLPSHSIPNINSKNGTYTKDGIVYKHHSTLPQEQSAFYSTTRKQKWILVGICVLFGLGLFLNWHTSLVILLAILTTLYFADLLFNFFLIYKSFTKEPEIKITQEEITAVKKRDWPLYTIFCPLYKEWNVLPQFVTAIDKLDYPKNKLQVLLLLEEDDQESLQNIKTYKLPKYFTLLVVPHSQPKTKPKALNYGLKYTKGEYAVIFDAEDVPEQDQLKKAVLAFQKSAKDIACIQAKLNFYNPHHNILTRIFTAEYSLWFDLVLTGLQAIHAPIPLGGTSNHFKTKELRRLQGWDAFNVTEDADLGTRLAKNGYYTAIIDSTTLEEANSSVKNWLRQRSRWIKGYIQTYLVHMRHPEQFSKSFKKPDVLTFQFVVGAKILSLFINPLMWFITFSYFLFRPFLGNFVESFYSSPIMYMGVASLVFGNFLYIYYYMIGLAKRGHEELIPFVFLVPIYWLGMSVASWIALYEIIIKPHYWAKTLHGFHLQNEKASKQSQSVIGRNSIDKALAKYPLDLSPAFSKKGW